MSWLPHARTGATKKAKKGKSAFIPKPSHTYHVVGQRDGIEGFVVRYDGKFYRGGEPKSRDAAKYFKAWGIKTIVSVTPTDLERELARDYGLELVEVPFEKGKPLSAEALGALHRTLKADGGPYYSHCHGGTQRGGAIGFFFRMHVQKWSFENAAMEYKNLGGDYAANETMLQSIADYKP